jgi:hypothetical protein
MKSTKELAIEIIKLLKENNATIRGYEGEVSCVIIENSDPLDKGASIDNNIQNFKEKYV